MTTICPFCNPDADRVFLRLPNVVALWDGFPVTDGHALLVPVRHVADWFAASSDERAALFGAIEIACAAIRERWGADGFNVGFNLGQAAGQTVPHLHLHVIPRRRGDVDDPRGGIRHIIPGKGNYLLSGSSSDKAHCQQFDAPAIARDASIDLSYFDTASRDQASFLTTGGNAPLLVPLEQDLAHAKRVDIAVAFVLQSGVERLYSHFIDLLQRGGTLRLVTGDYLDITDPDALQRLLDLREIAGPDRCVLRIFVSDGVSFHPKAYLISHSHGSEVCYVGSSNLSQSALTDGVEWNLRVSSARDIGAWRQVETAFESLFQHPATVALDDPWLRDYRSRRRVAPPTAPRQIDVELEPPAPPPVPNTVQLEALAALAETRRAGNRSGLVVMATGLGKTWLAAFDTNRPEFKRILFVAHREEILAQAIATFRRIRPTADIGLFAGGDRAVDRELVFASVQTLSRREHLERFSESAFDYIVVDEFHHAAAATYRRLIDHFSPSFLLGLTATPERADGGDLLSLCSENVVYRCPVPRGIDLGLLCEFDYFGVPDDVDYAAIPWRSNRFDEEALTNAVATQRRADNVFDQWRKRGGAKTIAFCASRRHADFMRDWFRERGVSCASVHSGPTSDERTLSLEKLAAGGLAVVFAVDIFNEGVDVPMIDTVMMLRPTESPIVWLQQFGRGLRKFGDKRLKVVDYIGNHRSFLTKVRTLLALGSVSDREIRAALERVESREYELPRGCNVVYELRALDILRALLRTNGDASGALREYYEDFRLRHGQRPSATETFQDGYLPRAARTTYGSWFGLVEALGDLTTSQSHALARVKPFLSGLETTRMTRSFKMLVLLAMLNADAMPGPGLSLDELAREFARLAKRSSRLTSDVGANLDDPAALQRYLLDNPVAAWTGRTAMSDDVYFVMEAGTFRFSPSVPAEARAGFQELVRELVDWRLAEYLSRHEVETLPSGFVSKVSHAGGRPILFYPEGRDRADIPEGWQPLIIDGTRHEGNFVKVALNVVRLPGTEENRLPGILRGWFGPDAGRPGTNQQVVCESSDGELVLRPIDRRESDVAEPFRRYTREQIPRLFGDQFNPALWNAGFVVVTPKDPKHLCLLVTLNKGDMSREFQYIDRFLEPDLFQWQSQTRTRRESAHGRLLRDHVALGVQVHLFVRADKKRAGAAAPFTYCGPVSFVEWEGDAPITVHWRLGRALPERLWADFGLYT